MKKLFMIFLIHIVLKETYSLCPFSCNCTETVVSCMGQELDNVPNFQELDTSPVIIDLSGNQIDSVTYRSFNFSKRHEVIEMYLNSSEVIFIETNAFQALENLQELYLGDNLLKSVPEFMIATLNDIILLEMSNNYFYSDMPVIRSNSLEVLAITNSKISHVPLDALKYLPNLKLLLLQRNNIQTLKSEVFNNCPPQSITVKLSYNAWKCDCNLLKTFRFLMKNTFLDLSEPFNCQTSQNRLIDMFKHARMINNLTKECLNRNQLKLDYSMKMLISQEKWTDVKTKNMHNDSLYIEDQYIEDYAINNVSIENDRHLQNYTKKFTYTLQENGFNFVLYVIAAGIFISFFFGFIAGLLFWRLFYLIKFRKVKAASDSRVQLLASI